MFGESSSKPQPKQPPTELTPGETPPAPELPNEFTPEIIRSDDMSMEITADDLEASWELIKKFIEIMNRLYPAAEYYPPREFPESSFASSDQIGLAAVYNLYWDRRKNTFALTLLDASIYNEEIKRAFMTAVRKLKQTPASEIGR